MRARSDRLPSLFAALALLLAGTTASAATLPAPVVEQGYTLRKVGGGELRWMGFSIYDASLWTSSGRFQGFTPGETVALSLWYQRAFKRDDLLGITETAWRKLGEPDAATRERWLADLERAWSDVAPGHNVTTVVVAGGPTRFYDQRGRFAEVQDPSFGPAFLAIWLHPKSVVRDLRERLLGGDATATAQARN